MSKLKFIVIVSVLLAVIAAALAGVVYFRAKAQGYYGKLEEMARFYGKLDVSEQELKTKHTILTRDYDALKKDRDNLIARAKELMADSGRLKDVEQDLEKARSTQQALEDEKKALLEKEAALNTKIAELETAQSTIARERDSIKSEYTELKRSKDAVDVNALKDQATDLAMSKAKLEASLKENEQNIDQLTTTQSKLLREKQDLVEQLEKYKRNYNAMVKKNKQLSTEMRDMPKKFAELARENKLLVKETSALHYNTGVFYTKNKEYDRARTEFEKAIELNPDDASAHFNLGYIYAEYMVDRKKAIDQFRQYLRLAEEGDGDIDWARKYILTWVTYEGKETLK